MVELSDGEKNFDDMFIRFDTTQERDRRTDGQTDRHRMTAKSALDASIARIKRTKNKSRKPTCGQMSSSWRRDQYQCFCESSGFVIVHYHKSCLCIGLVNLPQRCASVVGTCRRAARC